MSHRSLRGVIPALVTPMHEDGSIDYDALERQAAYLAESGVHGYFVSGTTGEGPLLSREERRTAIRIVQSVKGEGQLLCAACIAPTAQLVIDEIRDIEPLAPDFVVCVPPFYYPVSQEAIIDHFSMIAQSTDLPLILYDIPPHTHNPIELDTRMRLIEMGVGSGLKDSSGDFGSFSRSVFASHGKEFAWIQGSDLLDAYSLMIGAKGVVSGLSNVLPGPFLELFERSEAGDPAGMIERQRTIVELSRIVGQTRGGGQAAIKAAVAYLGRSEPWMRLTALTATAEEQAAIAEVVDRVRATGAGRPGW